METETNELIQELADWMVTCAAEGTKNGSWTIYADDIVEEFTSITGMAGREPGRNLQ